MKTMKLRRIGPDNPGVSRLFAARVALLVMAGFYAAGLALAALYALGISPPLLQR